MTQIQCHKLYCAHLINYQAKNQPEIEMILRLFLPRYDEISQIGKK